MCAGRARSGGALFFKLQPKMDLSNAKTSYAMMTPEEARARATRESKEGTHTVEMYDWEYQRLETPVPAALVRSTVLAARGKYLQLRGQFPAESDEQLRERVRDDDARFRALSTTHPRMFEKVTKPELPADHLQLLLQMIEMRRAQENGMPLERATAQVTEFFKTKVAPVEGRRPQEELDEFSAAEIRRAEREFQGLAPADQNKSEGV